MENEYRFFKEDDKIKRFHVERDDEPYNPREECDNLAHMMCWYKGYSLGDKNPFGTPDEFLDELIKQEYEDKSIIRYIKNKKNKTDNNLSIKYNRKDKTYELYGDYNTWTCGRNHGLLYEQTIEEWLVDGILDYLSIGDKLTLLTKKQYVFMHLAVYEHGGITMWSGSRWDHFDARWDCSDIGWIYVTKKEVMEAGSWLKTKKGYVKTTDRNWKQTAEQICEAEVKVYDMYLQGDCYGYVVDTLNTDLVNCKRPDISDIESDDMYWDKDDSCWGYYSEKYGDELVSEMIFNIAVTDYSKTVAAYI